MLNRDVWYKPAPDNPIVGAMNQFVDTYELYHLSLFVDLGGKLIAVSDRERRVTRSYLLLGSAGESGSFSQAS